MKSMLALAIEEHGSVTEQEKEYSYFLKLSQEQLDSIKHLPGAKVSTTFSETKLPASEGLSSRIRHYTRYDESVYELTTKLSTGELETKEETNDPLSRVNYDALFRMGISTNIRNRITVPLMKDGAPVQKKDGPLEWEIDLYYTKDSSEVCAWVKIELEVDVVAFPDIIDLIPIEYLDLISSDSSDEQDRAFIRHLYDDVYNVRTGVLGPDNIDTLEFK